MWPTYASGVGAGRNRRLLKDRDGRPAMARSSSRRRKESSRKVESAVNAAAFGNSPPSCAEEYFENETLPALPPSRPSTASPTPSLRSVDKDLDLSKPLYRLPLPPITPESLQPYLEDETTRESEQLALKEAAGSASSEDHVHATENAKNEMKLLVKSGAEPFVPLALKETLFTEPYKSELDCEPSRKHLHVNPRVFPEPARLVPSPTPYHALPVASTIQTHALANSMMEPYYTRRNTELLPPYDPHVLLHWPLGAQPPEWQYQVDSQGMLPSGGMISSLAETQQPVVPLRPILHDYEETAMEVLVLQVKKVATDIDVLRVQMKELLSNIDKQAWNVRELERRLDDLRQRLNRRDEQRSDFSRQNALERSALQSKINLLENQVQKKEDSTSLENHSLHAQLSAATHEISRLKEALTLKARDSELLSNQVPVSMEHYQLGEAAFSKYHTLVAMESLDATSKSTQENTSHTRARQGRHHLDIANTFLGKDSRRQSEPRVQPRHAHVGERKDNREEASQTRSTVQHSDKYDLSISHPLQLRQSQPARRSVDCSKRKGLSMYDRNVSERKMERMAQRKNTAESDEGGEMEQDIQRRI